MSLRTLVSLFALTVACTELPPPPPRSDATAPSDTPPPPIDVTDATLADLVDASDAPPPRTTARLTGAFVSSAIPSRPGGRLAGGFVWTAPLRTPRLEAWLR